MGQATFLLPSWLTAFYCERLMPRIPGGSNAGHAYHVLNRGNGGAAVLNKDADHAAFLDLLGATKARHPVKIFGFCLMPPIIFIWSCANHQGNPQPVHAVDDQPCPTLPSTPPQSWQCLARSLQEFSIQQDDHLLTVLRYILLNPA